MKQLLKGKAKGDSAAERADQKNPYNACVSSKNR